MTGFIINGGQHRISANIADCISRYSPKLNFSNCFDTRVAKYNSTYFVYCQNGIEPGGESTMYDHARTTLNAGYNFSAYRTVCKTPTEISAMVDKFSTYAAGKGLKVKYVDPYTYYNLLKSSGQGANVGTASTPSTPSTPTPDPYIPPDPNVLVSFDSKEGISSAFSTSIAIETANRSEGRGSMRMGFGNPTGESAGTKIGGMAYYEFTTPVDLSDANAFTLDFWLADAVVGSAGLQVNFVTNGKEDGYNFMMGINDSQPGWHTLTINKATPSATAQNANWSSIRAIRITYFNYANNAKPTFMLIDNLRIDKEAGGTTDPVDPTPPTPPTPAATNVLLNFDSLSGYTGYYATSTAIESVNKSQGSGSMRLGFNNPTAQASSNKIGGMVTYEFSGTADLSKAKTVTLDYWIPEKIVGSAAIQINFVTNGKDDGYNFSIAIDDATPGWHTISADMTKPSVTTNNPNWSNIRAIRITYYNLANNAKPNYMLLDNLAVDAAITLQTVKSEVLLNFDSTANMSSEFQTALSVSSTEKKEGSGAVRVDFANPTGQFESTKIGGMAYYEFTTPVDLSKVGTFTLDFWLADAVVGSAGLQVNFVTNGKDDGYNFMMGINDFQPGWHTLTINKATPGAVAKDPNWSSIRAIRITYFNYDNNAKPNCMIFDNLKAITNG